MATQVPEPGVLASESMSHAGHLGVVLQKRKNRAVGWYGSPSMLAEMSKLVVSRVGFQGDLYGMLLPGGLGKWKLNGEHLSHVLKIRGRCRLVSIDPRHKWVRISAFSSLYVVLSRPFHYQALAMTHLGLGQNNTMI